MMRTYLIAAILILGGCAAAPPQPPCGAGFQELPDCPPLGAVQDEAIATRYEERRWRSPEELKLDPVVYAMQADIPLQPARARIIGASYEDSVASLAAKIWLVDNARYSVDAAYYILKQDLVGQAFFGALCEAVRRGVDVRVMVDAVGSYSPNNKALKALENCALDAGFMINEAGQVTVHKARVQGVVFGALTNIQTNYNRRSHDKLLVVDGAWPEHAWVMTGGRNMSLSYYGLRADGTPDPTAYKDLEILLRPEPTDDRRDNVGFFSEAYFSLLFANPSNKRLSTRMAYDDTIEQSLAALQQLRAMPAFAEAYANTGDYLQQQMRPVQVRLAHELHNMISRDVVSSYDDNLETNPNSIIYIMREISRLDPDNRNLRIVSPYIFVPKYERSDRTVFHDGARAAMEWLARHPDNRLEIITNSVLTSDNFFAQAIIDMDTAPRLLLNVDDVKERWRSLRDRDEADSDLVASGLWQQLVSHPRLRIYQTGRLDSDLLGGDVAYGKLHAKFILTDLIGFVGTTNLDYRSRLFNNEMGFFILGDELRDDLAVEFEALKSQSYLWGSPEWLQLREAVRSMGGQKGSWASRQRSTFTNLRQTNLHWQF